MGYQSGRAEADIVELRAPASTRRGGRRSSTWSAHPRAPRRPGRLVGARRDRHGRDRRAAGRRARRAGPTTGTPGWTPRWCRCPAGSGCTSPRGRRPEEVVRELYEGGVRRRPPTDADGPGEARRGKPEPAAPPAGAAPAAPEPEAARRGRATARSGAPSCRGTPRFAERLPGGRRARRGGARRARWPTTPTRRSRWSPTWCTPPTRRCARRRARLAPRLILDRSRPGRPRRRGIGAARGRCRPPAAATSTSTPRWTAVVDGPRRAAAARPRRADRPRLGDARSSRCACSSTPPAR